MKPTLATKQRHIARYIRQNTDIALQVVNEKPYYEDQAARPGLPAFDRFNLWHVSEQRVRTVGT